MTEGEVICNGKVIGRDTDFIQDAGVVIETPEILILDEPMNGLDKTSVLTIRAILLEFVEQGGTLLMTSHNSEEIQVCCQNIYEFDNGSIVLRDA